MPQVAEDEARHHCLLAERLRELGSHYGALPAHDGLWETAMQTAVRPTDHQCTIKAWPGVFLQRELCIR